MELNTLPTDIEQSCISYLNKKEIDILERHVLAAISKCSVFEFSECKKVYLRTKSFDKTIEILKKSVEIKKSPHIIMDELGLKRQ